MSSWGPYKAVFNKGVKEEKSQVKSAPVSSKSIKPTSMLVLVRIVSPASGISDCIMEICAFTSTGNTIRSKYNKILIVFVSVANV